MDSRVRIVLTVLVVLLMAQGIGSVFAQELRAAAAEMRQEEDQALRELLTYSGPDEDRQFRSIAKLAEILGYEVRPLHEDIIRHQNRTHFGDRKADLTEAYRGLGKSTIGTITRAIAYAIRDPFVRILFASDTTESAESFHDEVQQHLLTNQTLIRLFGQFYAEQGSKTKFGRLNQRESTILQSVGRTTKEGTFTCRGIGKQMAGAHFDVIFGDDLVTLEKSRTATQRGNLVAWHGSTMLGTRMPHTKTHYIGTRYYPGDLWDELEHGRTDETTGPLKMSTLKLQMVTVLDDGEWVSNDPAAYSVDDCREVARMMGRYHFAAQMQQDTQSGEGIIFCYPDFRWWGGDEPEPPSRDQMQIFQYADLAAKKTDTGDYFAHITIGLADVRGEKRIYVLDGVQERAGMRRQRELILSQAAHWKPYRAGVEAVAMQAGFAEEIKHMTTLPISGVQIEADKVFRARRVSYLVEDHKVYFPMPDTATGQRLRWLIDELTTFPEADHDDGVDAFVGALTLAVFGTPKASSPALDDMDAARDSGLLANYD